MPTVADYRRWIRQLEKAMRELKFDSVQHEVIISAMQEHHRLYRMARDHLLKKQREV